MFKSFFSIIIIIALLAYFRVDIKNIIESDLVQKWVEKVVNLTK